MPAYLLDALNKAIDAGGLRLTELNNRMQSVNRGGVYPLSSEVRRYIARQMNKRDRETATHLLLRASRDEIKRLTDYIAMKAENEDWTNHPFSHISESGK